MNADEDAIYTLYHQGWAAGIHGLGYGHGQSEHTAASPHYQAGYRQGSYQHQWITDDPCSWKACARSMTECLLIDYPRQFHALRSDWQRQVADSHVRRRPPVPATSRPSRKPGKPRQIGMVTP